MGSVQQDLTIEQAQFRLTQGLPVYVKHPVVESYIEIIAIHPRNDGAAWRVAPADRSQPDLTADRFFSHDFRTLAPSADPHPKPDTP